MPTFGDRSNRCLSEADPRLQKIMQEAIKEIDFAVICGYRNKEDQAKAKAEGKSNASFGQSPHNFVPAMAVDICPWPKAFKATVPEWEELTNVIVRVADRLGIPITLGRDFVSKSGKKLVDRPHFELTGWREMVKR